MGLGAVGMEVRIAWIDIARLGSLEFLSKGRNTFSLNLLVDCDQD